ncbi:hypothetical protein BH20BAC1_BH20BAC1_23730 [soil metagenome]
MAFRKKAAFILTHKPDILIIIECEHPDKLLFTTDLPKPKDTPWFGKNQHKGLAILSYGDYRFKVLENHNDNFKMIIPIAVTEGHFDFNLFLIWAYNPDDTEGRYITQVWKAVSHYDELLTDRPTMLIGDFNSNTIWDYKKHRLGSHAGVIKQLENKKIFSTYHLHYNQIQGTENIRHFICIGAPPHGGCPHPTFLEYTPDKCIKQIYPNPKKPETLICGQRIILGNFNLQKKSTNSVPRYRHTCTEQKKF